MPLAVTFVMVKGILGCSDHEAIVNAAVFQAVTMLSQNWGFRFLPPIGQARPECSIYYSTQRQNLIILFMNVLLNAA